MFSGRSCTKDFRILIFGIVVVTLLPSLGECCWGRMAPKFGGMTDDYDLLVGNELVLNCTLRSHNVSFDQKNTYYANSSHLVFRKTKRQLSEFVHTIDEFTAQLRIPVSTLEDSGSYLCQLKVPEVPEEHVVCGSKVSIGYKPQPVKSFQCISMFYENLTCTWDPAENGVHTTYSLKKYIRLWKYFEDYQKSLQSCPSESSNNTYCQWRGDTEPPFDPSELEFAFSLIGSNSLGSHNQTFIIKHYEILLPNSPQSLRVVTVTKREMTLNWNLPKHIESANKKPPLFYQLMVEEITKEPETKVIDVGTNVLTYTISDLIPHMKYNISLRCRSNATSDDSMWSPFTSVQKQMLPDVPFDTPVTIPEAYEIHHYDKSRAVTLYWKPVSQRLYNGPNFMYHIVCSMENSSMADEITTVETRNVSTLSTKFSNLNNDVVYTFSLYSMNELGLSEDFETLVVDAQRNVPSLPDDITAISHDLGHYEISWKPAALETESTDYVIFWCSSLKPWVMRCDSSIEWINSTLGENNVTLDLYDNATNFQFAVASRTAQGNSGVKWATCIVPYKAALGKISYVVVEPKDSTSLKIIWRLDCVAQKAVVKKFEIIYCESDEKHQCKEARQSVEVMESKAENYLLEGLQPFSNYSIVIRAYNLADIPSEDSDPKVQATKQGAPADPPQEVKILSTSNSSVHIAWQPPKQPNGVITQYKVWYNNNMKVLNAAHFQDGYEMELTDLQHYTNYSIRVQACVIKDLCSFVSAPVVVQTDVGVPGEMGPPRIEPVNSTLLTISWNKPLLPNGPISFYEVQWQEVTGDNISADIKMEYKITDEGTSMQVAMSCASFEDGGVKYMFSVRAANIKNDSVLFGPISPPTQARACLLSLGVAMVIGAAIGGTLALAIVLLLVYKLVKWMSEKIHQVKSITVRLPKGLDGPENNPLSNYENFKNGLVPQKVTTAKIGHQSYIIDDSDSKNRHGSGSSQYSYSSTEELLYKNGKCTKFSRKPSGESSGCSSLSSNLTKSHASSETSTESDFMMPPSPDVVFSDHGNHKNALSIVLEDKDSVLMDDTTKDVMQIEGKRETDLTLMNADQKFSDFGMSGYSTSLPPWISSLAFYSFNLSNSEPSINNTKDSDCTMMPYSKLGIAKSSGNIIGLTSVDMDLGYSRIGKMQDGSEAKFPVEVPFGKDSAIIDTKYINGIVMLPDQQILNSNVSQCQSLYGIEKNDGLGVFTVPSGFSTEKNNNTGDCAYIKIRKANGPIPLKSGYVPFSDVSNFCKTNYPVSKSPPAEDDVSRLDLSNGELPLECSDSNLTEASPQKYLEYNPDSVAIIFANPSVPTAPPLLDYQYNCGKDVGCELDVNSLADNFVFSGYGDSFSSVKNESSDSASETEDRMIVDLTSVMNDDLSASILQENVPHQNYSNSTNDVNIAAVKTLPGEHIDKDMRAYREFPSKDTKSSVLNGYVPLSTLSNVNFGSSPAVPKLENKPGVTNLEKKAAPNVPESPSNVHYKTKQLNRTNSEDTCRYKIYPKHDLCNDHQKNDLISANEPEHIQPVFHYIPLKETEVCNV